MMHVCGLFVPLWRSRWAGTTKAPSSMEGAFVRGRSERMEPRRSLWVVTRGWWSRDSDAWDHHATRSDRGHLIDGFVVSGVALDLVDVGGASQRRP